jgi:DNA-binding NarL/FixJ family response regulator
VSEAGRVRVLIVDDNALFREGLAALLSQRPDIAVVGSAASGEEAVRRAPVLRPHVVLMDVAMAGIGGVEATRRLLAAYPSAAVCMLTVSEQESDLFAAVRAGARGYLLKSVCLVDLARAIHTLAKGGALITPHLARELLTAFQRLSAPVAASGTERLTARERQILGLVGRGLSNQDIAARLCITENTVKVHLRNILDKLHVHSRAHAAAIAARAGLTGPIRAMDKDTAVGQPPT